MSLLISDWLPLKKFKSLIFFNFEWKFNSKAFFNNIDLKIYIWFENQDIDYSSEKKSKKREKKWYNIFPQKKLESFFLSTKIYLF